MNQNARHDRLVREVRFLKIYAAASSLLLAGLLVMGFTQERAPRVIDVERINVLNPDGGLALAIAGKGNLPGPTFEGREYPQRFSGGRLGASGMIFFNERGDEVGGLMFQGRLGEGGESYAASGALTFDQFRQDQVVSLSYSDNGENRSAGVRVWDRSTEIPISRVLELVEIRDTATGAALDSVNARIRGLRDQGLAATRVFLGSDDRTAMLLLRDTRSRPRIRLAVDSAGVARLEFLDEQGGVVHRVPDA